jgi:hypothetical protein
LNEWKKSRLGEESKENAPCPHCKSQIGYKLCAFKNRELGSVRVKCDNSHHGCKDKVARNDMEEHKRRFCQFTKVQCKNRILGCNWEDFRYTAHRHDEECDFLKRAEERKKRQAQIDTANGYIEEMEKKKTEILATITAATELAKLTLHNKELALYATQACALMGKMNAMIKIRTPDKQTVQVTTRSGKSVPMQLEIRIDEEKFFSLHCNFVELTRFPLWVTGFIKLNDPVFKGPDACRQFHLQFEGRDAGYEIFNEREAWPEEVDVRQRQQAIQFHMVTRIIYPTDPRD